MRTVVTFLLIIFAGLTVQAATLNVPGDYATIQSAIDAAGNRDTVQVSPGVYSGEGNRDITFGGKGVTLRSALGAQVTTIDCQKLGRAFFLINEPAEDPVIEGFTIRNGEGGNKGGALECYIISPTIRQCVFVNNSARWGGVLYCNGGLTKSGELALSTPLIENCTFIANSAEGGGVYYSNHHASASFLACLMVGNSSDDGAPVQASSHGGNLTLSCCNLYANLPGDWIGGLEGQEFINSNFSADPQFCDFGSETGLINRQSPCAPANNTCQTLIGAQEPWCGYVCGDVNGDDAASSADILELSDLYFHGGNGVWSNSPGAVDMDCDGMITIADLILLAGYVYGYGPDPCCVEPPPPPPPVHEPRVAHSLEAR